MTFFILLPHSYEYILVRKNNNEAFLNFSAWMSYEAIQEQYFWSAIKFFSIKYVLKYDRQFILIGYKLPGQLHWFQNTSMLTTSLCTWPNLDNGIGKSHFTKYSIVILTPFYNLDTTRSYIKRYQEVLGSIPEISFISFKFH